MSKGKKTRQFQQGDPSGLADLEKRLSSKRETIAFLLALLGFVVAAVSALVSWMQWQAMREQLEESRLATRLEYRPWVVIQRAELPDRIEVGKSPIIRVHVLNGGRTPAANVSAFYNIRLENVPIHGGGMLPKAEFQGETHLYGRDFQSVMIANDTGIFQVDALTFLKADDVENIRNGSRPMKADGYVGYQDMFGESHRTYFCYSTQVVQGVMEMVACAKNNVTDHLPAEYVGQAARRR